MRGELPERNKAMIHSAGTESRKLAAFASRLELADIPAAVVARFEDLLVDWIGSALSGKGQPAIGSLERYAARMGPGSGNSEIVTNRRTTSALFAAMVNAAASHISEQDDVHNASVFHPGAVVFPPALATAQEIEASGADFVAGCIAGYEIGSRCLDRFRPPDRPEPGRAIPDRPSLCQHRGGKSDAFRCGAQIRRA